MIRLILFAIIVVIACILSLPVWLCMWIIHFFNQDLTDRIAFVFIHTLCTVEIFIAGTRLTVEGQENLSTGEPVLYIMNHRSLFDIIIMYKLLSEKTGFIAKKELKKALFLAQWILLNHGLFLDRENIREGLKTILRGVEYIKAGFSMAIFPEGTRNKDKESHTSLLPFHGGSFKLAEKSGVPVVPIAFYNTENCFENHKPFIKAVDVKVRIGEPVNLSELSQEDRRRIGPYFEELMQGMLDSFEA